MTVSLHDRQADTLGEDLIGLDDYSSVEVETLEADEQIIKPFDPTKIHVGSSTLTVDLILSRIREKEIDLAPDFQRKGGIWSPQVQSRLIESLLIRIPLPAFYMDATDEDRWVVVDGLQRLTTLKRFVLDGSLRLRGLEYLKDYEGEFYSGLPRNYQRRINESQLTIYVIERGTPPTVKFNVFKRINTGGLPLSPQEIRHALYQGKSTQLLEELAESENFRQATNYGIRDDRMSDRECVLRFLTFMLTPYKNYRTEGFDALLIETLERINKLSDQEIEMLRKSFQRAMRAAVAIFDKNAFRKPSLPGSRRRPRISKTLFEAWSVNLHSCTDQQLQLLVQDRDNLIQRFQELVERDAEFERSTTLGTGTVSRVQIRFGRIDSLIQKVLHDYTAPRS